MEEAKRGDRAKSHQERPLRFFRTPLNKELEQVQVEDLEHSPSNDKNALQQEKTRSSARSLLSSLKSQFAGKQPPVHHHHEATPSELFYDLFFVANLTTYTGATQNAITDIEGVGNYIGFFCVMWFTWFQVALFDVRFSRDSVFDRICKTGHFGAMVGFSFIALQFDPSGQNIADRTGYVDGKAFSLILMADRLILTVQYAVTLFALRAYPKVRVPLASAVIGHFIAAMVFLGVSFEFGPTRALPGHDHAYISWYVISIVESTLGVILSSTWKSVSFKGTHLCERMNLLTLIVLGEGILSLSRGIGYVCVNTEYYTSLGSTILSSTILLYAFFQLYFDTVPQDQLGSVRQHIWAFLHFPLHLALILFDEGLKQTVRWNTAINHLATWLHMFKFVGIGQSLWLYVYSNDNIESAKVGNGTEYFRNESMHLMNTFYTFSNSSAGTGVIGKADIGYLQGLANDVGNGQTDTPLHVLQLTSQFFVRVANASLETFQLKVNSYDTVSLAPGSPEYKKNAYKAFDLYVLVFRYFYISTGIAALLILLLWLISKLSKTTWFDYLRFGVWFSIGTTITLLSLINLHPDFISLYSGFQNGPWVLPIPTILIVVLLVVFHLPFGENSWRK